MAACGLLLFAVIVLVTVMLLFAVVVAVVVRLLIQETNTFSRIMPSSERYLLQLAYTMSDPRYIVLLLRNSSNDCQNEGAYQGSKLSRRAFFAS